ncbi:MAG: response regulator [Desulfobacterales bacterium]|nr:response regulator [Desulfobacterales bacterium]
MKILLVDDEQGIRKVLGIALADGGYEVTEACDGREAARMVHEIPPDIVLTDIRMPGMDGIELLKCIKTDFPDIEVIMITGHGDLRLAIESLKLDAVDFITKPINNDILEIALKRARDRIDTRKQLRKYTRGLEDLVKEKTRKLAASEKRYVQLFNESPSYITIQDRDFNIVESNNRFKEEFGDSTGLSCYQVYKQRQSPCEGCPVSKTFADGASHLAEMDVTMADGSVRHFLVQTSAVADPDGAVAHVMEMSTDVTYIHDLQDHLAALGLHISSISHGIKGILTGLDGGDYLISTGIKKQDNEMVADGWDIVKEKISMVRKMVLDILFHSKNRELEIGPEDVFDLVQEITTALDPKMKENRIVLKLDVPKPGTLLPMDKVVLMPAFLAILENAIDACAACAACATSSESGKYDPEIRISVSEEENRMVFRFRDNGKGLDRAYKKEIFSLFYSDKGKKGTGLGLFIAKRAVKQHRGTIRVDSEPGKFTRFTISLPMSSQ